MYNIKIVTDSGCDIPVKARLKNVEILGFYITINGKTYEERKDLSNKEYYDILENCADIPSTAHITMMRFGEKYESLERQGATHIIVVTINRGRSATYDAACMAKKMFFEEHPDSKLSIEIIDSGCYSVGYGWQIMKADEMIEKGASPEKIADFLREKFSKTEILLCAYTLRFMKKSGRISAAASFVGEALGLKPIVALIHGESQVLRKARGEKAAIAALINQYKTRCRENGEYLIGYTYEEYGKELYSACVKEIGYPPRGSFELGSVVTTNAGNRAVGMLYMGK